MASPPFGSQESGTRLHSYSRKEKSLGVLCTNFLRLYNRDGIESIGLDDAATQLGVERRRIYDVVNILESVGVVARKAKNQYSWKGFAGIPRALEGLEEEGFRENFNNSGCFSVAKDQSKNENGESSAPTKVEGQENTSSNNDSRREKSLAQLTENFVKLFLCTDVKLITLDNAATALLGDGQNSSATKVRRLYDITNVLSSINLIEKTHHPESRKQGFRWLGWRGKPKTELLTALLHNESKKRMFGTDITNHCSKRAKLEPSINQHSNKAIMNMPTPHTHSKDSSSENVQDGNESEQTPSHSAKSFAYGPFSPVGVLQKGHSGNKNGRQPQDWENLASTFRPQYRNEALCDLFGHYKEAWKSWYTEVAGKEEIHPIP